MFDLVFFAGDAVEALVLRPVDVSLVPNALEELSHEFLVAWVGGANEAVVRDVQLRPPRRQDSCHEEIRWRTARPSHTCHTCDTCEAASTSDVVQTSDFRLLVSDIAERVSVPSLVETQTWSADFEMLLVECGERECGRRGGCAHVWILCGSHDWPTVVQGAPYLANVKKNTG